MFSSPLSYVAPTKTLSNTLLPTLVEPTTTPRYGSGTVGIRLGKSAWDPV